MVGDFESLFWKYIQKGWSKRIRVRVEIPVNNNIFVYKLFDKRYTFPFIIVHVPCNDSSIPQNIFYLAIFKT